MTTKAALSLLICSIFSFQGWAALPKGATPFATAKLEAKSGSKAEGTVEFLKKGAHLLVSVQLSNVAPGKHGFHIHENGDCSAADASSAGGHFNPTGHKHGGPKTSARHLGDFGNIEVGADGTVKTEFEIQQKGAFRNWTQIVDKSIVLHKDADDLVTDPSGKSGERIACGVIQSAPGVPEH